MDVASKRRESCGRLQNVSKTPVDSRARAKTVEHSATGSNRRGSKPLRQKSHAIIHLAFTLHKGSTPSLLSGQRCMTMRPFRRSPDRSRHGRLNRPLAIIPIEQRSASIQFRLNTQPHRTGTAGGGVRSTVAVTTLASTRLLATGQIVGLPLQYSRPVPKNGPASDCNHAG